MTAILPEQPVAVAPLIPEPVVEGASYLLQALDLVPRPTVPSWITDPDVIASICAGLIDIPDDLNPKEPQ